jgi:1-deoxy-D-xylulose-5-phosphate synthase
MADHQYQAHVSRLGIPDAIIEHGSQLQLHRECGFDPQGIEKTVRDMILQPVRV